MWITFSIFAAISFGLRGILYHWTSQKPLNRNALLCGTFVMGALVNLIISLSISSTWSLACLIGIQMGLFSFGGNASMFKGFAVGKASLVAVLTSLPSVVVVIMAFFMWNERLHLMQLIAFLIIVGGVLLVRYSNDLSLKDLKGAQWGILATLLFAGNDLSGKWSTMMGAELYPSMFMLFTTGAICFGLWWMKDRRAEAAEARAQIAAASAMSAGANAGMVASTARPSRWSDRRTFLIGMAVGTTNTLGMMLIITAFGLGKAGLVSAVVALNVLIVLLYTRFIVKDKFTRTEIAGIVLSFLGILLMRLFGA